MGPKLRQKLAVPLRIFFETIGMGFMVGFMMGFMMDVAGIEFHIQ